MVNKYNEHEIRTAEEMAKKLNVEFRLDYICLMLHEDVPDNDMAGETNELIEKWVPKNKELVALRYKRIIKYPLSNEICSQLFESVTINSDGKVYPCCYIIDEKNCFGDLTKQHFKDIWYSDKYVSSRNFFVKKKFKGSLVKTICYTCKNFKKV